ncbi:uncharacterized protein LOC142830692 [Pelodiscus sinensis]|uniref:uncharacterized protein LOC142830692 n=1 Tax=Pelodiscus sinensis TaxID=13735 RepID=UPI003F6D6CFA
MNTKKNLLGVLYKSNSEKRDTSLRRSCVQTPEQGTSQPSQMVVTQPLQGTSQLSRTVAPQLSWVRASLATPPAPPTPTPTLPAQPCCHCLSQLLSQGPRQLQQCCSHVWEHISSPEKDPFRLPRAKVASESADGAEGTSGTAKPLPTIQPPAAAASGPATNRAQPKKQMAPKNPAPPPGERNPLGALQAGTGLLPSSRLCASQQQQEQQLQPQPQPRPPQHPGMSIPTCTHGRSVRSPGTVARPEPEAAVPTTSYTINLTTKATRLPMRRHLENHGGWMNPFGDNRLLSQGRASMEQISLMKISLVTVQNHYDDEQYEEDPAPGAVNQELVRRCTEWLRGVEEARREGQLETPPYLDDP